MNGFQSHGRAYQSCPTWHVLHSRRDQNRKKLVKTGSPEIKIDSIKTLQEHITSHCFRHSLQHLLKRHQAYSTADQFKFKEPCQWHNWITASQIKRGDTGTRVHVVTASYSIKWLNSTIKCKKQLYVSLCFAPRYIYDDIPYANTHCGSIWPWWQVVWGVKTNKQTQKIRLTC